MAEKCTNTSSPVDRWINPNPLAALNHLTTPFSFTYFSPEHCPLRPKKTKSYEGIFVAPELSRAITNNLLLITIKIVPDDSTQVKRKRSAGPHPATGLDPSELWLDAGNR
jgi:hypothetical protein